MQSIRAAIAAAVFLAFSHFAHAATVVSALEDGPLGLHESAGLKIGTGRCSDCGPIPQALWYFRDETLALPVAGTQPPLIWIGSPSVIPRTRLSADGKSIVLESGSVDLDIVPKISTNRSYYNADSQNYLSKRPLRLRGELQKTERRAQFVARTIWPLDFAITSNNAVQILEANESLRTLVRSQPVGAGAQFSSRLLWERNPGTPRDWNNKAVLGIMLNGAQGDDDEAHAGHFAIATGRYRNDGDWSRWTVYNFYNLDSFSEKGIIAAPTPMDKYMLDLNNGQNWYRPSYMLVVVLKNDRIALQYQTGIEGVYNHFYRHDFVYDHAAANCSGISVDTLRSLGWNFPQRGHEPLYKAIGAYAYVASNNGSLTDARKIYDHLMEETTRLYPAVSFDALGEDLFDIVQGKVQRPLSAYEKALAEDVEAIYYVYIPQIPSSRAFGRAPVYSFDEYMARAPEDRSEWKIVPVKPRPFPEEMRGGPALEQSSPALVPLPVAAIVLLLIAGIVGGIFFWRRRKT